MKCEPRPWVLSLLCVLPLAAACSGGDDDTESTPSPTDPPATATAVPATETEAPTATPIPPTATQAPSTPTDEPSTPTEEPIDCSSPPEGCDFYVCPSDDDQAAVQQALIDATVGQTVCLSEGTFSFYNEVSLSVDDVTIKGAGKDATTLDFSEQIQGGNGIQITGDGCTVDGFTVYNTPGDGIRASDVEGVTFRGVRVLWVSNNPTDNGAYGLYPVGSKYVLIEDCEVSGASDAGVYVGQSDSIIVQRNEAHNNVAGIEIENSTNAEVMDNWSHDNTGGILVFNLPELPVKHGRWANVHDNLIENNNTTNFAPEGNIVGIVPTGTGVIILATDENEFHGNVVKGNVSAGFAIFSYDETLVGDSWDDPEFDPYPERNYIHDNLFVDNGEDPKEIARALLVALNAVSEEDDLIRPPLPAMLWDGCVNPAAEVETKNCFSGNGDTEGDGGAVEGDATFGIFDLCGEPAFSGYSFDVSPYVCTYTPLEAQSW